jgi:predicted tellurium resistance membrane protein TerC
MLTIWTDPNAWLSLATLTLLEIILGVDNVIFLAIVSSRVPKARRGAARRIGLAIALILRIALLSSVAFVLQMQRPILTFYDIGLSWRDLVLGAGGLFLLTKGTQEIHAEVEGPHDPEIDGKASFYAVIFQIAVLDLVFSIDSVVTAVGMAEYLEIMIAAVVLAILIMMAAAAPIGEFINRHPSVKMLGLSFLLLIGVALVADAAHFHIPRNYLYFAIAFSALVESLNMLASRARERKKTSAGHEKTR